MTTERLRVLSAVVAVVALVSTVTTLHCAGDRSEGAGVTEAGTDATSDAADARDGNIADVDGSDAQPVCDAPSSDGLAVSDWPGWQRLAGLDPCCVVDVPIDPAAAIPKLEWQACSEGTPDCLEMKIASAGARPFVRRASVTRDATGAPKLFLIRWALDSDHAKVEDDVYDVATGAKVAAFRSDLVSSCLTRLVGSGDAGTLEIFMTHAGSVFLAHDEARALMLSPRFQSMGSVHAALVLQESATSDTDYAFDLQPAGLIGRTKLGSGSYVTTQGKGAPALIFDLIEAADVFALSEFGTAGWMQEYRIDPDGTPVAFRSLPDRHASAFRTDGTTMFWSETQGDFTPTPRMVEIWAAPYTADPLALSKTARRIATVPGLYPPGEAVAFTGLYAVRTSNDFHVVRLSDGASRVVTLGPDFGSWSVTLITRTELWTAVSIRGGPNGVGFRRIGLGSW